MWITILVTPLFSISQGHENEIFPQHTEDSKGIKWTTAASWEQVRQIAKEENKYLFLDAYATWCGPCKAMDKSVYVNDTVGDFFNDKFVSVKVQMDKTKKYQDITKSWYNDVEAIKRQFHIEAFPSFVFLNPDGQIVHLEIGYKNVSDFIVMAKNALLPGKVYNDPYKEYDSLVKSYKQGIKNNERLTFMIDFALKLQQSEFAIQLLKEQVAYVKTLSKEKRYTRENLQVWNSIDFSTKTTIFQFFYKDGEIIDRVMGDPGFSKRVIDRSIKTQFINPFFKEQNKDSTITMLGMVQMDNGKLKRNFDDADWKKLEDSIRHNVDEYYAKKNVLSAKIEWYSRHRNYEKSSEMALAYW
jgi:thioredoxin-related protein